MQHQFYNLCVRWTKISSSIATASFSDLKSFSVSADAPRKDLSSAVQVAIYRERCQVQFDLATHLTNKIHEYFGAHAKYAVLSIVHVQVPTCCLVQLKLCRIKTLFTQNLEMEC